VIDLPRQDVLIQELGPCRVLGRPAHDRRQPSDNADALAGDCFPSRAEVAPGGLDVHLEDGDLQRRNTGFEQAGQPQGIPTADL